MRASSLSDAKVITLLNRFFVPVYVSNEDYGDGGSAEPAEKAAYQRIFREAHKAGLATGTVQVYILSAEGHPLETLHVAKAYQPDQLIPLLERTVQKLKPRPGAALIKPATQSPPPKHGDDSLVLHLTARVLQAGSGWDGFPVENWIVLQRRQWTGFLPPGHIAAGKSWDIDKKAAAEVLQYFYPATENNNVSSNRLDRQELKGQVLSVRDGIVRVRLTGQLKMKHTFYQKEDTNVVDASLIGFLDFDPRKNTIRSFRLVTDEATYARGTFGVAVRSVP
jgi:hypothetical protein